jgi:hypothetical protein
MDPILLKCSTPPLHAGNIPLILSVASRFCVFRINEKWMRGREKRPPEVGIPFRNSGKKSRKASCIKPDLPVRF